MTTLYLSGPDIFSPNAWDIAESKKEICERYGMTAMSPFDLEGGRPFDGGKEQAKSHYDACRELLDTCDGLVANVSPFRGPSMDSGTAYEMGLAHGLGKPVVAYSLDTQSYVDRLRQLHAAFESPLQSVQGHFHAPDGLIVENFDLHDTLMVASAASSSGVPLVEDFESAVRWIRRLIQEN